MDDLRSLPSFGSLSQSLTDQGDEVLHDLDQFELDVQEMCQALHAQVLDFLYDEELRDLVSPILENYELTYAALDSLRDALHQGQPWKPAWEEAQLRLSLALQDYPALTDWHERQTKVSASPYIHELVRVGRACLEEKLPWESFAFRLDEYRKVLEEFCARYQQEELEAGVWGLHQEQREDLELLVEQLFACVAELGGEDPEPDDFSFALEQLLEQGNRLLHWQNSVTLDFEQPMRGDLSCPRCGQSNTKTSRVCDRCGARLPQDISQTMSSRVDFHSDKAAATLPNRVAELVDSIERFLNGDLSASTLLGQVAEARQKAEQVAQQLRRLPELPEQAPEPARQLLGDGRQLMSETQAAYLEALNNLQEAVECDESMLLPVQEKLVDCASAYQQLEEISQRLSSELHRGH
jgi:uncharacterized Zn finger protein (UPF0148 family)